MAHFELWYNWIDPDIVIFVQINFGHVFACSTQTTKSGYDFRGFEVES